MIKFLKHLFAGQPAPSRPVTIRKKRINPVFVLEPEAPPRDRLYGKVCSSISEVRSGNDVSGTQHALDVRLSGEGSEL